MEFELINPFQVHGTFNFYINFDEIMPNNKKYKINGIG